MSLRAVTRSLAALAALAVASSACTSDRPTGVVTGVTTQMQIPRDLKYIRIIGKLGTQPILHETYRVVDGTVKLPGTLTFAPADGVGRGSTIVISVLGYEALPDVLDPEVEGQVSLGRRGSTEPRLLRRSVLQYDAGRVVYLPMPLSYSCLGVQCKNVNETCVAGRCVADKLDVATLPTYVQGLVESTSEACFDATTCMKLEVPARLAGMPAIDANTSAIDRCTFTVPDKLPSGERITVPGGASINVRVVYGSANPSDPSSMPRSEVLDYGPEGFTIPDPSKPGVFRLADGLCNKAVAASTTNMMTEVYVAPSKLCVDGDCERVKLPVPCLSKRASQSLCQRDLDRTGPSGTGGTTCEENALVPSPSVMGILVDRRDTMHGPLTSPFFGTMIGLPLGGTLLRNTSVSLAFTPPKTDANACLGAAFVTPAYADPSRFDPTGTISTSTIFGFGWTAAPAAVKKFTDLQGIRTLLAGPSGPFGTPEYGGLYEDFMADRPAAFDVALRAGGGFYEAIRTKMADPLVKAERGGLFVIGTREFSGSCATNAAVSAAAAARADAAAPIDTYVLAIKDSNINLDAAPLSAAAQALATAGGTTAYLGNTGGGADGTAKGLEALTESAIEIATCTYDAPPDLAPTGEISYVGADGARVKIAGNPTCAGNTGWRPSGNRVRLCSTTCTDYRKVVRARGLVAALGGAPLDEVPIVVRKGCND